VNQTPVFEAPVQIWNSICLGLAAGVSGFPDPTRGSEAAGFLLRTIRGAITEVTSILRTGQISSGKVTHVQKMSIDQVGVTLSRPASRKSNIDY